MRRFAWVVVGALAFGATGCEDAKPGGPAPKTSTLQDAKPKAAGAHEFEVSTDTAKVTFMMDAPNEKIRGNLATATTGKVQVPLEDITKTTGHLYVDLGQLVVGQNKPNDDGTFGEEWKEIPLQNEHAKEWLQIACVKVPDDKMAECEKVAKLNKNVEFVIESVETETKDVTKLTGDTRKVTATISGNFLLHQVAKKRSAKVEIVFTMKGDEPQSIAIKTVEPFAVKLSEHEVGPNDVFGKFAKGTLQTLDQFISEHKKVAEAAEISLDFTAKHTGMAKAAPAGAPSAATSAEK